MRKILFIFLALMVLGCSQQNVTSNNNYNYADLLFIKNGKKLIQGNEYEFFWKTSGLNSKVFYSAISFIFEKDGFSRNEIIKLEKIDSVFYRGFVRIPEFASSVYFALTTPLADLYCPYSITLPIYKDENTPEFGANSTLLYIADTQNYLKYFYNERSFYPDNYAIYLVRWLYEMEKKIFVADSVRKHLEELKKEKDSPDIQLLKLVGNTMLMDYSEHSKILENMAQNLKCSNILNNQYVAGAVRQLFINNYEKDTVNIKKIIENIVKYCPNSMFSQGMIEPGPKNVKILPPSIILWLINKKLESQTDYDLLIPKFNILTFNFLPDSLEAAKILANKLYTDYINYFVDNDNYYKIKDYSHSLYSRIGMLPSAYKKLAFVTKDYDKYLGYMKEIAEKINYNLSSKALFYYDIGLVYDSLSILDSASKYFYYSHSLLPVRSLGYAQLKKLTPKMGYSDVDKFVADISKKYGFPLTKIGDNFPSIEYVDGTKEDIANNKVPKIVFFYNTTCGPCERAFKDLKKVKSLLDNKKIKLFFISPENTDKLKKWWIYDSFGVKVINNAAQIKSAFGSDDSVPQILLLNADSYIVNWITGYSPEGMNWEEILGKL